MIGTGAMGIVYEALHIELDQRVAIKVLHPSLADNAIAIERFRREARAVVKLRSEHVCRVMDVGTLGEGIPYIVMEYLEGQDLGAIVGEKNPLSPATALNYLIQTCDAVVEAHAAGIVHRDLKPQNLFLTHRLDGTPIVKVLDFGLAKGEYAQGEELTATGEVMGTPHFMSPEQITGMNSVDFRSDLWALGAVLFNLLTAQTPFGASNFLELRMSVTGKNHRSVRDLQPSIPESLQLIIDRCLAKDPNARYESVRALAHDLKTALPAKSKSPPATSGRRPLVLLSFLAFAVGGAALFFLNWSRPPTALVAPAPSIVLSPSANVDAANSAFSESRPEVPPHPSVPPAPISPRNPRSVTRPPKPPKITPVDDPPDIRH